MQTGKHLHGFAKLVIWLRYCLGYCLFCRALKKYILHGRHCNKAVTDGPTSKRVFSNILGSVILRLYPIFSYFYS